MSEKTVGGSMTAAMSAFARGYHREMNSGREMVFDDGLAKSLIGDARWAEMATSLSGGAKFFGAPCDGDEGLRWIVDKKLSASPLGRAAFTEEALKREVMLGARRYVVLGAGYDTFAYRQPLWAKDIDIVEVDRAQSQASKRNSLMSAEIETPENVFYVSCDLADDGWTAQIACDEPFYSKGAAKTFCAMPGLTYYMSETELADLLKGLRDFMREGSAVAFDYPNRAWAENRGSGSVAMAAGAGEVMKGAAGYDFRRLEELLASCGFLIFEHLEPVEITHRYFSKYNESCFDVPQHRIMAEDDINYCLAVLK